MRIVEVHPYIVNNLEIHLVTKYCSQKVQLLLKEFWWKAFLCSHRYEPALFFHVFITLKAIPDYIYIYIYLLIGTLFIDKTNLPSKILELSGVSSFQTISNASFLASSSGSFYFDLSNSWRSHIRQSAFSISIIKISGWGPNLNFKTDSWNDFSCWSLLTTTLERTWDELNCLDTPLLFTKTSF